MFLTTSFYDISIGQAGIYALLGYAAVFLGLILLMLVILFVGKLFVVRTKAPAPVLEEIPIPAPKTAPGTAGQLKLHDVEPKVAAMLMAIVADKLGKPVNELRFLSIREVQE